MAVRGESPQSMSGRRRAKLRSCMDTIQRIIHDGALPTACFRFGYLDRFVGVIERDVGSANWGDIALLDLANAKEMAVPKHRIQYIKCNGEIVWDKRDRKDLFWSGEGIRGVLARQLNDGMWSSETMAPVDRDTVAGDRDVASTKKKTKKMQTRKRPRNIGRGPSAVTGRATSQKSTNGTDTFST